MSELSDLRAACAAPLPHPDAGQLADHADSVLRWLLHHEATLPDQPVFRPAARAEMNALLAGAAPEEGEPFGEVLRRFEERVAAFACRTNHPRFLAFIPGAPTPVSALGDMLCAGTNFFAGVWLEAAGPAQVELVVLDWFRTWLGLPPSTSGLLTSGGSEANLTALCVAREPLSYEDRARAVLYAGEHRHWSVDRAARVLGFRPEQTRPVPSDAELRLDPRALAELVRRDRAEGLLPWAVVASAGTTNTGAVDPLSAIADVTERERLWYHVDAAYGWTAALTEEGKALLAGVERADSVTLDPHKWLAQTFEAGGLLVREGRRLRETFAIRPEYMQDVEPGDDEVNFADHGVALTRRFRALKVWLSVRVLGLGWFRRLTEHGCALARYAEGRLRALGFEVLSPARLSVVCFRHPTPPAQSRRHAPRDASPDAERQRCGAEAAHHAERDAYSGPGRLDAWQLELLDRVRATGRAFLSSTRLGGSVALRLCFVNWRTSADDVDAVVALIQEAAGGVH